MKTATLTIVFTDIKGFTERTSRSTLEDNQRLLALHSSLLTPIFRAFRGRIVKEIGDAFLVTFESPTQAVLAGAAIQDRLWEHNRTASEAERLDVRVAMNMGEVRVQGGDVFGEPVNIASRVEGEAEAGGVWFTEAVYLAMNKAEVPAEELGLFELKGIPGKVRLYRVPRGPYRVDAPAASPGAPGTAADGPPFGNLGLSRMPDDPTARAVMATVDLTQRAVVATGRALKEGEARVRSSARPLAARLAASRGRHAAGAVLVGVAVVAALAFFGRGSEAERALDEVRGAPASERKVKAKRARQLIEAEPDQAERQLLLGRLAASLDDPNAALAHFANAHRAGADDAEDEIIASLEHEQCSFRVAGLETIRKLGLSSAEGEVERLAERGGTDDREKVLFFGCNSKSTASEVLQALRARR